MAIRDAVYLCLAHNSTTARVHLAACIRQAACCLAEGISAKLCTLWLVCVRQFAAAFTRRPQLDIGLGHHCVQVLCGGLMRAVKMLAC